MTQITLKRCPQSSRTFLPRIDRNDSLSSHGPRTADQETTGSRTEGQGVDALSVHSRLIELEVENLRLQQLVAELLIKNQELRILHRAAISVANSAAVS